MNPRPGHSQKGTVILVTLCFVAVIGIVLTSYITICSRAMTLSGRTGQSGLSKQLAELGLEEALRAFNGNYLSGTSASAGLADWSANGITVDWTLDTTNKRATANITFSSAATKFGTSVANASVKVRVDNYDAAQLPATWVSTAKYRPGNLVGYNGTWYRCISAHTSKTPSATNSNNMYWIQEQSRVLESMTWVSGSDYIVGDMIQRKGSWYRCKTAHTGGASNQPPNSGYWVAVPYVSADSDLYYTNESILNYYTYWYRYNSGWDGYLPYGSGTWTVNWFWQPSVSYLVGDIVWYSNIWYRCRNANTDAVFTPANWDTATTLATNAAAAWNWNSNYNYNVGDAVYHSGTSSWYRCLVANSGQTPSSTSAYWSASPQLVNTWDTYRQYSQHDTVYYNGTWYRSLQNNQYGQNPATQTSYWASAANASYQWNSTTAYSAGTYCSYGGVWYQCLVGNTGKSPNNTAYWTAAWTNSSGVKTGAPVAYAESTVTLGDGSTSKTQLRATLSPAPLFPNAVGSTTTITINGGGTVDSYDSNAGTYASQVGTSTNYSAVLAATNTGGANPAVYIVGTDVKGYVAAPSASTSPYAPLFSSGGSVKGASSPASPSIDTSHVSRSPYVPVFNPQPGSGLSSAFSLWNFPSGTVLPTNINGTVTIGTPGAVTPTRYYWDGTLDIASSAYYATNECTTLNIIGPVVLYINGGLRVRGGGSIVIKETGSAEIHADGSIRAESTSSGIDNQTLDPKKLVLISDVSSTSSQYYASATPLYGVIYAPNTTASLGFEIRNNAEIYGAISARKVTFTADANVHYDTSLRYATIPGVDQPYAIAQWRELTDATELATMP